MHQLVQSAGAIEGERQESIHTIRCTFVAFSLTTVRVFFARRLCLKIAG